LYEYCYATHDMRRPEDSIKVRAKKMELLEVLDDYILRLKLRRDVYALTKKIEEYEAKCGIKRYRTLNTNMSSPIKEQVLTRVE